MKLSVKTITIALLILTFSAPFSHSFFNSPNLNSKINQLGGSANNFKNGIGNLASNSYNQASNQMQGLKSQASQSYNEASQSFGKSLQGFGSQLGVSGIPGLGGFLGGQGSNNGTSFQETPPNCTWSGSSPLCAGDCPQGLIEVGHDKSGDGLHCLLGWKVLCCP